MTRRSQAHAHGAHAECATCTLAHLRRGDRCVVLGIDDELARAQATRFGMAEGASVSCVTALPAGPVVVRSGRQEIAVGRRLARRIRIRHLSSQESA
ncbi:MAG: ferrous iron transport protein A [Actinomycetia bacterium]|nr:ferrous iron transport protein A [Actinomycetes bacterium]